MAPSPPVPVYSKIHEIIPERLLLSSIGMVFEANTRSEELELNWISKADLKSVNLL